MYLFASQMPPVMKHMGGCRQAVGRGGRGGGKERGRPPPPSPSDLCLLLPSPPQLCRAARCLSVEQEVAVVEALEVTAAEAVAAAAAVGAAAAGALVAVALKGVEGPTEEAPERAVEVVMGAAAVEIMERAAKAEASRGAEIVAPPNCRSSKLLPTLPTRISWSRGEGFYDPRSCSLPLVLLIPSQLPFPDGCQQFGQ